MYMFNHSPFTTSSNPMKWDAFTRTVFRECKMMSAKEMFEELGFKQVLCINPNNIGNNPACEEYSLYGINPLSTI